ncbi:hypothetical protein AFB00_05210 [Pseudonocardia sp. HH130630-07]|nr:hypothetical protein AFB00_05210 [Pseudonocardia sp. HH130630-07]
MDLMGGATMSRSSQLTKTLAAALVESRPVVQAVSLLRFFTAVVLAGTAIGGIRELLPVLTSATAVFLSAFAVYLANGVADVVEDRANGSRRPIASGRLDERHAALLAAAAGGLAVPFALSVGPPAVVAVTAYLAAGIAYSFGPLPLKNRVSTFMSAVAVLGVSTYALGVAAVGALPLEVVVLALSMSGWMACGGLSKDLSDVVGDRVAGRRTWPVVFGMRVARRATAGATVLVAIGFGVAAALVAPLLVPAALAAAAGATVLVAELLLPQEGARPARRPYQVFMWTQYAVHLVVLATCLLVL